MTFDPDKQLRIDSDFAGETLLKNGELATMVVFHGPRRQLVVLPSANPDTKHLVYPILHLMAITEDAHAVTVMMEAWSLVGDAAKDAQRTGLMPSQSERRIETLFVSIFFRAGGKLKSRLVFREIMRDAAGKISGLGPIPSAIGEPEEMGGRTSDILPATRPSPQQIARAKLALDEIKPFIGHLVPRMESVP